MSHFRKVSSISVFFPAYNDAETIGGMVESALAVLYEVADSYEVIVVNDGSTDATPRVLSDLARCTPNLRVIHHERNMGYGGALRTGFAHASKDLIFYTDGDGQYDVREMKSLLPLLTDDVDVVNGYKLKRSDARRRKILGAVYNRMARIMFRVPVRDVDCDFRLIRRQVMQRIKLASSSGVICVELVRKLHAARCVFAESPVHHYSRAHGRSQFFTVRRVSRTALDFLLLWTRLVALERFRCVARNLRCISSEKSATSW